MLLPILSLRRGLRLCLSWLGRGGREIRPLLCEWVIACIVDYGNKRSARGVVLDFDCAEKKTVIPIDARNLLGIEKRVFRKTKFSRVDCSPLRECRQIRGRGAAGKSSYFVRD